MKGIAPEGNMSTYLQNSRGETTSYKAQTRITIIFEWLATI